VCPRSACPPAEEVTPADFAAISGGTMTQEPGIAAHSDLIGMTVEHNPPAKLASGAP